MKPARIFILLLLAVGVIGATVTGFAIYSRLIYATVLLLAGSWAWTRWTISGVQLRRRARIERANVGDVFEEHYELTNSSRIPAAWVEIINRSKIPYAAGSRLWTTVLGKQKRIHAARTWLTRRGAFPLGPTRVVAGDPFGLFRAVLDVPPLQTLVALPMLFEIRDFPLPPGLLSGGQVIRKKAADITPHAAGVREYAHGDTLKRIHWRSSARRNQLMVKEFEQDPQSEIWLYLDLQSDAHFEKSQQIPDAPTELSLFSKRPKFNLPPSTLEYSVSIMASLAHYFIAQRRAVGFASVGQTIAVRPAERGARQESKILETLAFVEADGNLSIAALVSAQSSQLPQGSTAILVTPNTRPDLLVAVDDLQRRHMRPVVVLLDPATFGSSGNSFALVESLRARRIPVCVIACGADLSQVFSEFSSNLFS
jgi:uncharacterized protein (DUF58 family)